jgi:hypothetical protein
LRAYWISRWLLAALWFFVGGLPAWAIANLASPFFEGLARRNSFFPLLILLPIGAVSWGGGFILLFLSFGIWPPGFAAFLYPECIDFNFRDPALAVEFAHLNGVGKNETAG